ncbi:MAG: SCP-2 family sterol carrier protein [Oceanospirillaceae bacterium]|nr:SCP-2 family sterol carrier protein [Oceanospirillaceae bacterium]
MLRGLLKLNAKRYQLKNKKEVLEMSELQSIFTQMEQRFNPSAAEGTDAIFQYEISDAGHWVVTVQDSQCTIAEGDSDEATVTLRMDSATLEDVMSGETDGMQAFMSGQIQADGDIMLATKLAVLFPIA